jgi:hypothetical protein
VNVNRLVNIVASVHVDITYDLYLYIVIAVFFYFYCSNILENIAIDDSLYDNKVCVAFNRFNYPKVINLVVAVKIEVRNLHLRIIQLTLEVFKVS